MKSSAKNIQIASYDDLFKNDAERLADTQERIQELPLDKLLPFPDHPFKVLDDEKMQETVDSIKEYGVLVPILVRPKDDGTFEIVSGHRRQAGDKLFLVINGVGGTTYMEMNIIFRRACQVLQEAGIEVVMGRVGEYLTVQEQAGFQMIIGKLDADHVDYLNNHMSNAPYWTVGC